MNEKDKRIADLEHQLKYTAGQQSAWIRKEQRMKAAVDALVGLIEHPTWPWGDDMDGLSDLNVQYYRERIKYLEGEIERLQAELRKRKS